MKSFSIFILLIYWSVIILAPVINSDITASKLNNTILPLKKPSK